MNNKNFIFSLCVSIFMALSILPALAQSKTVQGHVIDESGQAIIGASIMVSGTTTGTVTDIDGAFTIQVPENGRLEISYIGYIPKTVSDFTNTTIVLEEDVTDLEEVVIVGYSSQKKKHVTGSISTVDMDEVLDLSSTSLAASLAGLMPGVSVSGGSARPGEQARINIRQSRETTSLSRVSGFVPETGPLYVIDGFISTETDFNNLEPTMVEDISVLKDGAAAIYGARSANGVILVTTKRGKLGKPKISYNGQFGFTDEVARAKMLSSYEYGKIWNGVRATTNPGSANVDVQRDLFQHDELEAMRSLNYDILDREWSSALTQKHSVNMSGANENANYFAGLSYNTQDGNLGSIEYDRWNYRAGVDLKLNKWIKATLQVAGDYGKNRKAYNKVGGSNAESDYNNLLTRPRYIPEYVDGRPISTFGPSNTSINASQDYHFGLIQDSDNYTQNMNQNMTINSSVEYDLGWNEITKGLKLRLSYSKNIGTSKSNEKGTKYVLYQMIERGGSGSHLYTGDDLNLDESNFVVRNVTNGNQLMRSMARSDGYQANFTASYNRAFGYHDVSGVFSIERSEFEMEDLRGSITDLYPFTNGQSNTATGDKNTDFGRSESGHLSYIGRLNYAYQSKYLFEFLVRSDASTKFAPRNYWGVFPSVSAGWIVSEEDWFKDNVNIIDNLKIRGSLGLLGRDNIQPWAWLRTYNLNPDKGPVLGSGNNIVSGTHIGVPDTDINPDAHWDKSYKSNIGLDFGMLRNRLNFVVDGYYEWNRDIFTTRSGDLVPSTIGTQAAAENYAKMNNYGIEVSVGWNDRVNKDFKYSVRANLGYSDNKNIKRFWRQQIGLDEVHPGQRSDTGIWGYEAMGMFRNYQDIEEYFDKYNITNYMGMTKDNVRPGMLIYRDVRSQQKPDGTYDGPDGIVDESDLVPIQNRSGSVFGTTLNMRAEWKGISLSTQVGVSLGGYNIMPRYARSISSLTSSAKGANVMQYVNLPSFWADNMFIYEDVEDANGRIIAEENRDAKYPNLQYELNSQQSTFWKVKRTNVTIRNITAAYSLPQTVTEKMGVDNLRFNLTVQNVLSLFNHYPDKFMDPLAGSYGSYPNLRLVTLGVNISF